MYVMAFRYTGTSTRVINFGSYNYLGFSQNTGPCAEAVEKSVNELGNAICASRQELGTMPFFVFDINNAIIKWGDGQNIHPKKKPMLLMYTKRKN